MTNSASLCLFRSGFLVALMLAASCGVPEPPSSCDDLPRAQCMKTTGCFLDYRGQPDSYVCRATKNGCESLTNDGGRPACEQAPGCAWSPGACYCPEGVLCFCSGGPPPSCRAS